MPTDPVNPPVHLTIYPGCLSRPNLSLLRSLNHRYTAYSIRTKTSRPNYGPAETIVLRRYSDFVWLREQLSYEYVGVPSLGHRL